MKAAELSSYQKWSILIGASVMLSLSMGMRQSFGLFQPSILHDTQITSADFSLATAIQNIVWGVRGNVNGPESLTLAIQFGVVGGPTITGGDRAWTTAGTLNS